MTQEERRFYLIKSLLKEQAKYENMHIPQNETKQKVMLRSLLNIRRPRPASEEFLQIQNAYLQEELQQKGITKLSSLEPVNDTMYIWQSDITTLECDAIVNAANSQLLGCFCPCHGCIDNAIHTFSGVQLRLACSSLMKKQECEEAIGGAKITPAFNLPCKYVIHTVGPTVYGRLTQCECDLLASCYRSCLETAEKNGLDSIAFCCISTGEFHFPNMEAAEIAIKTVSEFIDKKHSKMKVVFNVFKDLDLKIYNELLRKA